MFPIIQQQCEQLASKFHEIPEERKVVLRELIRVLRESQAQQKGLRIMYICTHNSRRSHFGQIWAAVAAAYYGINGVATFSAGTEMTALHVNAIQALQNLGFHIEQVTDEVNPKYAVAYQEGSALTCFSKKINDPSNPTNGFIAVMTCTDADENCPMVNGATARIALPYDDPKLYDDSPLELLKYKERSLQIGLECLYVFSKLNA